MPDIDQESWDRLFVAIDCGDPVACYDAWRGVGTRPLPITEDANTGQIKVPVGKDWGNQPHRTRIVKLKKMVSASVPVGIGVQPDGFVVVDVDPPGKDRRNLPMAWKEAAIVLLGSEDWPRTLTVATNAGAHVWFQSTPVIQQTWVDHGKLRFPLPSGGAVEFFTGNGAAQQVACPPTQGKQISVRQPPCEMPEGMESFLLQLLQTPTGPSPHVAADPGTLVIDRASDWFNDRLMILASNVCNAAEGTRHDVYRASVAVAAGYASSIGDDRLREITHLHLTSAHREAKPDVSDLVLEKTFDWAWERGWSLPLELPAYVYPEVKIDFHSTVQTEKPPNPEDDEPADIFTIFAKMQDRAWVWGDDETKTGWFLRRGVHLVEGKEGTGKTRWMMDLRRRIANDLPWPDGTPITLDTDSKILFVASDSHWDQIAMTAQSFGVPYDSVIFTGPKSDPYGFTSLDDPWTMQIIEKWCNRYKIDTVFVDTLMASSSRPLVDPQEVAQLTTPLRKLARDKNVAVVLCGHLNKDGSTWGRSIGRQCDNVIRLEADEKDEQSISIKSVKARWNRFILPVLHGRQSEVGWEYTTVNSETTTHTGRPARESERAKEIVWHYMRTYGTDGVGWSILIDLMIEERISKTTGRRVISEMVADGQLIRHEKTTFTGQTITIFQLPA